MKMVRDNLISKKEGKVLFIRGEKHEEFRYRM